MYPVRFKQRPCTTTMFVTEPGVSVMLDAVRNRVGGIDGKCGGRLDYTPCHSHVGEPQFSELPAPHEFEPLRMVATVQRRNGRLSSPLRPSSPTAPLVAYIPEKQL